MPARSGTRKGPSERMKHYIKRSRAGAARVAQDGTLWERIAAPPEGEALTRDQFRKTFHIGD